MDRRSRICNIGIVPDTKQIPIISYLWTYKTKCPAHPLKNVHYLHYLQIYPKNLLLPHQPSPKAMFQKPPQMPLPLVINSPLNAHLALLSVSPSNCCLLQGLAQGSPAVLTASWPSQFLFFAVSLLFLTGVWTADLGLCGVVLKWE